MIAGPVAVIPLACGRLELGLWPWGRLDTMVAGPVAVIPLACGRVELGLWPCGRLDTMVAGLVAVCSKMTLDGDEVDDDDDRDMFCIPPTLSVNGV